MEGSLAEGVREWWVPLDPGEAFRGVVEQLGDDVVVELSSADGELLVEIDQPIGAHGPEPVCRVAAGETAGPPGLVLRIRPYSQERSEAGGSYRLLTMYHGPARRQDGACADALEAFAEVQRRFRADGDVDRELLELAGQARRDWARAGMGSQEAVAWAEMAAVASELGYRAAEIDHREAALERLRQLPSTGGTARARLRALLFNDQGLAYREAGRMGRAREALEQALEIYRRLEDPRAEAAVLNNLGLVARVRGRVHQARETYLRVRELARALEPGRPSSLEATALLNLAAAETALGRHEEALDALAEANDQFEELGEETGRTRVLLLTGWVHTLAGREERALEPLGRAVERAAAAGEVEVEAAARDRLGTALRRAGRIGEARRSYRRALELAEASGRLKDQAHTLANLGWLELEAGRAQRALDLLGRARGFFQELEDPDALSFALTGLARAHSDLGGPERALEPMAAAVELMELQRSVARARGQRLLGVPLWPDYQEVYVDLLMELDAREPGAGYDLRAFEVAELARARHFYERLQDAGAGLREAADPELLAEEERLQGLLDQRESRWRRARTEGATREELARLERDLRATLSQLEDVAAAIRSEGSRGLELAEPVVVGATRVQQILGRGGSYLSLRLGEKRSFAFLVGPEGLHTEELPPRAEIERLARSFYEALQGPGFLHAQVELAGRTLAEGLLGPVVEHLRGRRLVISPDGFLHYLPLGVLPWPGSEGAGWSEDLLSHRFEVTTVPSATVLATLAREPRRWRPPGHVLVLADPVYPPESPLPRLPHSRREALAIRELAGPGRSRVLLGPEARTEVLKKPQALPPSVTGATVLHVSSHALIDEEHPELSRISLSGGDPDGALRVHEISRLNLPADLVVLSGCRTALGEAVQGEGLVGLSRSFFLAGSPRVLVSLWSVDDRATSVLMEHLYGFLFAGLRPAEALARAQEEMRRDPRWSGPVFWAGFSLQGDWR